MFLGWTTKNDTDTYDMIPHSWIRKTLEMFGIADNVRNMMRESTQKWNTELTAGGRILGNVRIRRGIFQGDSSSPLLFVIAIIPLSLILREVNITYDLGKGNGKLNHLLFMDDLKLFAKNENQLKSLIHTVRIFSDDIRMEFGLSKCALLIMNRGRFERSEGIDMPNGEIMKSIDEGGGYKYLGILEADGIKHGEMKETVSKEYVRRIRKILASKLIGGNIITAINSWAVSVIRYGAGIVNWT